MWGNILTEVSYIQNFNMSFSNNKSDVLIHLTQWQYWWWFWFSFLWVLYYLLVARVFRYRTLKFNPRIASTLRPHGKWGDLLTCIIPITWCINILINSNFILKLIEWQSESSLFTLRVRAKQWYWIYKLDLRNISDIYSAPRNIGKNKWQSSTFGDLQTAEDYLHIMQIRAYSGWSKNFWVELNKKSAKKRNFKMSSPVDVFKSEFINNAVLLKYRNVVALKSLTINSGVQNLTFLNTDKLLLNNKLLFSNGIDLINVSLKRRKVNFYPNTTTNQFLNKPFLLSEPIKDVELYNSNILNKSKKTSSKLNASSIDLFPKKPYYSVQKLRQLRTSVFSDVQPPVYKDLILSDNSLKFYKKQPLKQNVFIPNQLNVENFAKLFSYKISNINMTPKMNTLLNKYNTVVDKKINHFINIHDLEKNITLLKVVDDLREFYNTKLIKAIKFNKFMETKTSFPKHNKYIKYLHTINFPELPKSSISFNQFMLRALWKQNDSIILDNSWLHNKNFHQTYPSFNKKSSKFKLRFLKLHDIYTKNHINTKISHKVFKNIDQDGYVSNLFTNTLTRFKNKTPITNYNNNYRGKGGFLYFDVSEVFNNYKAYKAERYKSKPTLNNLLKFKEIILEQPNKVVLKKLIFTSSITQWVDKSEKFFVKLFNFDKFLDTQNKITVNPNKSLKNLRDFNGNRLNKDILTDKQFMFSKDFNIESKKFDRLWNFKIIKRKTPHNNLLWLKKTRSVRLNRTISKFLRNEILTNNTETKFALRHPDFDDETRIIRRNFGKPTPLRLLKCPNTDIFFKNDTKPFKKIELFRFRFNKVKSHLATKPIKPTVYLTFKQKRYNQRVNIGFKTSQYYDRTLNKASVYSGNPFLKNNSIVEENFGKPSKQYKLVKKSKTRTDTTRVANWNRLLRSRRVLVLPAHVNITVITNSFDIVHSWHIPGLGLKMDCLPGRATHHTLYIDNVGLYYGQCAEICGRYHHHMPIRVCALPFEHFLVWWHTFGLPKFLFFSDNKKDTTLFVKGNKHLSRHFSW